MKAVWQGEVIAESDKTVLVEGNHYFPLASVRQDCLTQSDTHTHCFWKGSASYYNIVVGDQTNSDAAWYYPSPKPEASQIAGHVAFWRGVTITD
jgi:uncharacterized protein (DUF427 family)